MGLLSFLHRSDNASSGASSRPVASDELTQQARSRAKQRLIGALVLVLIGVVGLPMLFDTDPRPLPPSTQVQVAGQDNRPSKRVTGKVIDETPADAGQELAVTRPPAAPPTVREAKTSPADVKPSQPSKDGERRSIEGKAGETRPDASAKVSQSTGKEAKAPAKAAEAEKPTPPSEGAGRFVVQVGAFRGHHCGR